MTKRTPVPKALIGRPLATRDIDIWGVPASRLRAADVTTPFRGVHVVGGEAMGLYERAEALAPLLRPGEAFSHATALALVGAPLPRGDRRIHVTITNGENRMRRPGVVGHRATQLPVTSHLGLPIVAPAQAWAQLARMLGHDDLVAVGDYLVTPDRHRRTPAIASIDALKTAIPPRARGAARARRALADVRVGAESRMETLLRLLLMRAGLPEPRLNPPVQAGPRTLHPDLFYPQWKLILEYEGDQHRTDPRQWRRDISRREAFQASGYRVMQVHSYDILAEPEAFLARVCHAIASQAGARSPR